LKEPNSELLRVLAKNDKKVRKLKRDTINSDIVGVTRHNQLGDIKGSSQGNHLSDADFALINGDLKASKASVSNVTNESKATMFASPTFTTYARCDYTPSNVHDLVTKEHLDAVLNSCAAAKSDDGQELTYGGYDEIVFEHEDYDYLSEYSTVNGRFTAAVSGIYHVDCGVLLDSEAWSDGEVSLLGVGVNGTVQRVLDRYEAGSVDTYYVKLKGSCDVYCPAGQYISIFVFNNYIGGHGHLYAGYEYNFVTIHRVK
jgi:hypothetical protein